jgi:hypothetical protein
MHAQATASFCMQKYGFVIAAVPMIWHVLAYVSLQAHMRMQR